MSRVIRYLLLYIPYIYISRHVDNGVCRPPAMYACSHLMIDTNE